jgi:Uma2 family endonuclease
MSCLSKLDLFQHTLENERTDSPEYWIVDPQTQSVLFLELVSGCYQEVGNFKESMAILSPTFPQLALTVNEIFKNL